MESIHKYGDSTLELDSTLTSSGNIQYRYLTIEEGDVKLTAQNASVGNLNIKGNTLYLNGNTLMMGSVAAENGAVIDATSAGSAIGGFCNVTATSGTVVMTNGGNDVTLAGIVGASNGATLKLTGSGKWNLTSASYNTSTGTLRIEDATQLDFSFGNKGAYTYYSVFGMRGILDLDTDIQTLQAASDNVSQHMTFETIKLNGQDLTLKEKSKSATWIISNLDSGTTSDSTLTWEASCSNQTQYTDRESSDVTQTVTVTNASRLILNGDNQFNGNVVAKRIANGSGFSTFVELAHDNALKNATLDMQSISGSTMALAINTSNAKIKGLTGDENAYAYSGASSDIKLDSAREGDGKNTLTITGSGSYDYKGAVNGLNIAMDGTGTQIFSGSDIKAQNISALKGNLEFTHAPTVADTISIAQGATLKLGDSYSLNEGVTLALIAGDGTQGTLNSPLILNGGTMEFDSTALNASTSLLNADIDFGESFTSQAISFSNHNQLELGSTYTLLTGDWSNRYATMADSMPDYLKGSLFTADSTGLKVEIRLADDFHEWQGSNTVFATDNTVLFRDTAPTKALNFTQSTAAESLLFVNQETYTFDGSDVTLSNELNMEKGKLVLNNKLTTAEYIATDGEVELGANGVLVLTNTQASTATVSNISGTGTLQLKLDTTNNTYGNKLAIDEDFKGTTHVTAGNLTLTGSTFGNTLKLAGGINTQITAATTIDGNLELEGSSEVHQNSGNTLTINGSVSGDSGTWVRKGGGTLHLNGSVNLAGFDTGSDDTTSNFNGSTNIATVTLDQSNITANFNGKATVGTLTPSGSNVNLGGSGTLTVSHFNMAAGKSVTIDGLSMIENENNAKTWNGNNETTINLKNGAVLDTRLSDYAVTKTMSVGGADADGTMYINGIRLSTVTTENGYGGTLNVNSGAHLVISGEASGNGNGDFVLALYGEQQHYYGHSNAINIDGTLTSNAFMTLMHNNATLNVNNGGSLNLLKGLTLTGECKTNLMKNKVTATFNVKEGGRVYAAGGTNHSELAVSFASGSTLGAIGAADSTVTFTNNMTLGTDGATGTITIDTAATTADEDLLLTRSEDKGVIVDMTGSLNLKGNTTLEVIGSGTLKHKSAFNNATAIQVQKGATLAVDSTAGLSAATELNKGALALDSATVSGSGVSISDAATIRATGGTSTMSAATTLTNEAVVTYDIAGGAELKSTGSLTADAARGSLIKQGAGTLQLNNEANALANIKVDAGKLNIHGAAAYDLNDLEAATSANLGFYAGAVGDTATEADVRVSGTARFDAGVKLNANLTLSTGSSLEVADGGLAMGSTLTLQEGLTLGDSTLARVRGLSAGQSTTLFSGVDGLTLGDKEYTSITENDSILAMPYFSNLDSSNYVLTYTGTDNGSLNITMMSASVPEPTSSMLGLVGLVAFTLRRRRK